jgi:hypothetical protein
VLRFGRSANLLLGFGFWRPAKAGRQFFVRYFLSANKRLIDAGKGVSLSR